MLDHGLELLEVLRISMPTPRGQEAQLDQVVEAHWIAREGCIDNASSNEKDDQDQFSSYGPDVLGLDAVGDAATGRAEALLLKDLDPDLKVGLSCSEPGSRRLVSALLVWFVIGAISSPWSWQPVHRRSPCCPM
jgi:hypothetical protein